VCTKQYCSSQPCTCNEITIGKFQVFKNRKMPGRMGGVQRTVKNVWVYQIDPARNLLYLKGQVA